MNSPNVIEALRIVKRLGGSITTVKSGGKHMIVDAVTRMGNRVKLIMSKHKVEPYKLKGWTRQQFNKADAAAARVKRDG